MALSTHTGGAADKAGFYHESMWGIRCMLEVINGDADSMRIETPGEDGAEFYLQRGKIKEHWQTKRQVTGQGTWSLNKLKGVLEFFYQKYCAGDVCVFASISGAPELRMLSENAQAAKKSGYALSDFKAHFLDKKRAAQFSEIQKLMGDISEKDAFEFLCSINFLVGCENSMDPTIGFALTAWFRSPWQVTMAALRELYLRSTHEQITATDIERHLQSCDIERRRTGAADAKERISDITNNYVSGQRAKLIRGALIVRTVATDVVNKIQTSDSSLDILITAPAGGGKSACLCQIVGELRGASIPVLAFRLDRIEPVPSVIQLGEKLGLCESPAFVLSEAFCHQPVVLVIDQLDCVSTTSGRHPDFFDTVASLCAEVMGLRMQHKMHIIFTCRKFDFTHDHRLKQLIAKDQNPIELSSLSIDEVQSILLQEGGDISKLTPHQQTMLLLPQNLSLFVDSGLAKAEHSFSTPKELCDAYWIAKRKAVSFQKSDFDQHWLNAITHLAQTMSERQVLSVPAIDMDQFPPDYLDRMASEGVFTWDCKRYGFGHETFFDYCFARTQPRGGREFVEFLESDMQHLFRRAQLRQVLAFLRDSDFPAYLTEVENLLNSDKIRPHLKLLAVDMVVTQTHVQEEELNILLPYVQKELSLRSDSKQNPDKLSSRIWERFFYSRTAFPTVDKAGLIHSWLSSEDSLLKDTIAKYLRWQAVDHAERVAELLEPFVNNAEWRMRLRLVMELGHLEKNRRFFDLFLRLLDNGTLDQAKDRYISNGTFWSMLYGLAEKRPDWCSELAARWLDRQISHLKSLPDTIDNFCTFFSDNFGVDDLFKSANGAPYAFLDHVLPAILNAASAFTYETNECKLAYDRLWPMRFKSDFDGLLESFPNACETAIKNIGTHSPDDLRPYIDSLLGYNLYTANHLLMNAYLSHPLTYAEEAMSLLINEPQRLKCGYSDSSYWISRQLIQECSQLCSKKTFQALENVLVNYKSDFELTRNGLKSLGHAAFNLVSSLATHRLSVNAAKQLIVWQRKFNTPETAPKGIQCYTVESPIDENSAGMMTDKQWLRAIAKYQSKRGFNFQNPKKGGAYELASQLKEFTVKNPNRFAHLALKFPTNVNPVYLSYVLSALENSEVSSITKLQIARRLFDGDQQDCFQTVLSILTSLNADLNLPEDAIDYIRKMAGHADPEAQFQGEKSQNYGGDILSIGINSVRGCTARAIAKLIDSDSRFIAVFQNTIDNLVKDDSVAVRSCAALILLSVAQNDVDKAIMWANTLLKSDDRLLGTRYVESLINLCIQVAPAFAFHTIERMLQSPYPKVRQAGGRLACLARLDHASAETVIETALSGDSSSRLGVSEVAKNSLLFAAYTDWCEGTLLRLFNDKYENVRKSAAGCFWHLWHSPDLPLTNFDKLIRGFLESPAFEEDPTFLLHALEETRHKIPDVVLNVCETFIKRCSEDARDVRAPFAGDEHIIGKLVFTSYAQLQSKPQQVRALDAIDQMNLEGLNSVNSHLGEFER